MMNTSPELLLVGAGIVVVIIALGVWLGTQKWFPKALLLVVGAIFGVIVIGGAIAFFAARSTSNLPPAPPTIAENSNPPTRPVQIDTHPPPQLAHVQESNRTVERPFTNPPVAAGNLVVVTNTANTNDWEEKIDDIVGSDDPDTNKVAKLYALFPTLPPDGQEEAAQHLSNLVDDEDYAPLGEMLKNDKLPEGVLDELLADVLNRPNNLKLPLLLTVASDENHSKHDEAKDLLELYLGDDYGTDWNSWGQHMTNWMKENPD